MKRFISSHYNRDGSVKVSYDNGQLAFAAACKMRAKTDKIFSFYPCKKCGKFHIGVDKDLTKEYIKKP